MLYFLFLFINLQLICDYDYLSILFISRFLLTSKIKFSLLLTIFIQIKTLIDFNICFILDFHLVIISESFNLLYIYLNFIINFLMSYQVFMKSITLSFSGMVRNLLCLHFYFNRYLFDNFVKINDSLS